MSDTDKDKDKKSDPTEAPDFKKVVEHFLKSPPKPHNPKRNTTRKKQSKDAKSERGE